MTVHDLRDYNRTLETTEALVNQAILRHDLAEHSTRFSSIYSIVRNTLNSLNDPALKAALSQYWEEIKHRIRAAFPNAPEIQEWTSDGVQQILQQGEELVNQMKETVRSDTMSPEEKRETLYQHLNSLCTLSVRPGIFFDLKSVGVGIIFMWEKSFPWPIPPPLQDATIDPAKVLRIQTDIKQAAVNYSSLFEPNYQTSQTVDDRTNSVSQHLSKCATILLTSPLTQHPLSQVIPHVYIGSEEALLHAAGYHFSSGLRSNAPDSMRTFLATPSPSFSSIISLCCPVESLQPPSIQLEHFLSENPGKTIDRELAVKGIRWRCIPSTNFYEIKKEAFSQLVKACTKETQDEHLPEDLEDLDVRAWFRAVFKELDRAVFHGENVLVQCAQRGSLSLIILSAYLISRFNIASQRALAYVLGERKGARPEFFDFLPDYEKKLKARRAL